MIIGVFDWLAGIVSDFLSPAMNTLGTNILQCLDEGPRIIQTQLDLELNTPKPGIVRTTPETIESAVRTISGNTISLFHYKLWISNSLTNFYIVCIIILLIFQGVCQLTDTKLCNNGGLTRDEGTDLAYSFDSISIAYAKCTLGENLLISLNYLSIRINLHR